MSYHITNPNDTAFPDQHLIGQGLTKREFFAAMAMQGLISNWLEIAEYTSSYAGKSFPLWTEAVRLADKLIQELNKRETND